MKNLFLFGILFTLLAASGCRKDCVDPADPECSNYDPCTGYERADAGFRMLEIPIGTLRWNCDGEGPRDLEFEVDAIFGNGGTVYFRAIHEADRYEWKLGADHRIWTTREFSLGFAQNAVGDVPVTLITEKADALFCSGKAITRDTLTRILKIKRFPSDPWTDGWSMIFGNWRGHNEDKPDEDFEIEIIPGFPNRVNNLVPDCIDRSMDVGVGLRYMYIKGQTTPGCKRMCGIGMLQDDNQTLIIDYSYEETPGVRVNRRFVGEKVE
jgi:hypothetical protein